MQALRAWRWQEEKESNDPILNWFLIWSDRFTVIKQDLSTIPQPVKNLLNTCPSWWLRYGSISMFLCSMDFVAVYPWGIIQSDWFNRFSLIGLLLHATVGTVSRQFKTGIASVTIIIFRLTRSDFLNAFEGWPLEPLAWCAASMPQEEACCAIAQLVLHGREMPWLLQDQDSLLTRPGHRCLHWMPHGTLQTHRW